MKQFKTLINKHYKTEKQIEFYANTIGLTTKKLSSLVYSRHGYSAKQYINEKILREACWQLKFTTLTLGEIADNLGFDPVYFVKFFQRKTNTTPAKYRVHIKA